MEDIYEGQEYFNTNKIKSFGDYGKPTDNDNFRNHRR